MGKIYNPSFYFSKRKDADDALDILMLTKVGESIYGVSLI